MRLGTALYFLLFVTATILPRQAAAQVNPNPAAPKPAAPKPKPVTPAATATLKVYSDVPCTFYVDGEPKGTITDDRPLRVSLRAGEYMFKAVSKADGRDEVRDSYSITKEEVGTEPVYRVGLDRVVQQRLAMEQRESAERKQQQDQEEALRPMLIGVEQNMVRVAGGTFARGCTPDKYGGGCARDESPAHQVTVGTFHISKYEVTQALWTAVMGTTVGEQRNKSKGWELHGEGDQYPMYYVNWDEAQEFIVKLNELTGKRYRLPTEAEWEYAARGGSQSRGTEYAGSNDLGSVGWYDGNSGGKAHPVGQKAANELGLYDMSGNVWEWCSDWYGENYYGSSPSTDPSGPSSGRAHVVRGGSWYLAASFCRVAYRSGYSPDYRNSSRGFRLARTE